MIARLASFAATLLVAGHALAAEPELPVPETAADTPELFLTNEGWSGQWGLLFGLNNVLVQGSVLSSFGGLGASGSWFLSPVAAVRGGFSVSRSETPVQVTRTEVASGGQELVTYTYAPPGTTSSGVVTLRGDYVQRLMTSAVAPYAGAGLTLSFSQSQTDYADNLSIPDQTTTVHNRTSAFSVGLRGLLGAEWRLHPNFAFFAEYELSVTPFTYTDLRNSSAVENVAGGVRTVTTTTLNRSVPTWFNVGTSLVQGGVLGLLVFF